MGAVHGVALAALVAIASMPNAGCVVVSLFPLYEGAGLEEPTLVGSWRNEDEGVSLDVVAAEWRSYAVTWREPSGTYKGRAYLTRVAGDLFADVTAPPGEDRGPFLVPVHGWCRVQIAGDNLSLGALDHDWIANPARLASAPGARLDARGNVLLTAPTPSLRAWLARQARRPGAFAAPVALIRVSPQ